MQSAILTLYSVSPSTMSRLYLKSYHVRARLSISSLRNCLNRGLSRMTQVSRIEEAILSQPSAFEFVSGLCESTS